MRVLARQQLLLVLDNCEHLIGAAAELCAGLLAAADDVRVLATSREPLAVAGEARYRLGPLTLPGPDETGAGEGSEAVAPFADRARSADPRFALDEQTAAGVAELVARLDGMPLAIELAAARVEALGVGQLLDRLDDQFELLAGADRLAASRQRSLAATVEWSYQLLDETERRVFRAVSVFPGPFTLEAAEAVAGQDAAATVLRLVDCSLLIPPRVGPDGRSRYSMLETRLRGQAAGRGRGAGPGSGRAGWMGAGCGGAGRRGPADQDWGSRCRALARCRGCRHAPGAGLGDGPRPGGGAAAGRRAGLVVEAAGPARRSVPAAGRAGRVRRAGQLPVVHRPVLGRLGSVALVGPGRGAGGVHRAAGRGGGPAAVPGAGRRPDRPVPSIGMLGRDPEAVEDARRALAVAREADYPLGEVMALVFLAYAVAAVDDVHEAVRLAWQAEQFPGDIPPWTTRQCRMAVTEVLIQAGDFAAAEPVCAAALAASRDAGDLWNLPELLNRMALLDLRAGRAGDAAAHLREALQLALRAGTWSPDDLDYCGHLCAATGRPAEAVTAWAAYAHSRIGIGETGQTSPVAALNHHQPGLCRPPAPAPDRGLGTR